MSQSQNSVFRQQQVLYKSTHYYGLPKSTPSYPLSSRSISNNDGGSSSGARDKGRKRRASEDEEMTTIERFEEDDEAPTDVWHSCSVSATKRNRIQEKQVPLNKLLELLGKDELVELVSGLIDNNPQLQEEVDAMLAAHAAENPDLARNAKDAY
ncbi:hypothetical protein BCR43DRAFT_495258 [Syncephalastrum racemosum]|uniref:Tethering factor for nuclear proteasome STS1 n=1 Tax=Syncephalastrum racemosum TaxID=13706 RepID=A0A1X2H5K0_SYNRA|nr:hypothetical protein BCR43DRAFT_495258 [Syncephalastrum racemosum]